MAKAVFGLGPMVAHKTRVLMSRRENDCPVTSDGRGWRDPQPPKPELRWTLRKGERVAECRIVPHALGCELRVDVDRETRLTQVHRQEADADIHAATLEDGFREKGWA